MKLADFSRDNLAIATSLYEQGLQVLPAPLGKGIPLVKWSGYQKDGISPKLLPTWFPAGRPRNFWVMTGHVSGYIVIDGDSKEGEEWWAERVGREFLETAAIVQTARGRHYWFRIPDDWTEPVASWSVHPKDGDDHTISFDFRADLTGVIAPPSIHKSGHIYTWLTPLETAAEATPEMLDGTYRAYAPSAGDEGPGGGTVDSGGVTRSMLTTLLNKPPGADGSGRNDWLARVAGHYAKTYHRQRDLYDAHCQQANASMGTPLDEKEYNKTINSIWDGEHKRNNERELDSTCGWLKSGKVRMFTQIVITDTAGNRTYDMEEYANFDIQAKGVMVSEDFGRTYWVDITRRDPKDPATTQTITTVLPGHTLGDDRALQKWLAGFACSVLPPSRMHPREGRPGLRIQRYLEFQQPPEVTVSKVLGFDATILKDGGFITHDGVIVAEGLMTPEESGVTADPVLKKGSAPHHYGFDHSVEEARRLLAEVMTFHDETVTAVFGSWWAACLLKPQIEVNTALFPFMAIQAPSESGKTNGFFDMMTQLNGNTRGEMQPTRAALRDMAAANRNGIVWVDDLDDPTYLMELLRAATSGGSLTKMGEDRETIKNTAIVAPIVISGEALGIENQKALVDRAITLSVPSPVGRKSVNHPDRPQWDDILDVRTEYPAGLSVVAGHLVGEALGVTSEVLRCVQEGRRSVGGRAADKVGILRGGARLLDYLVGQDEAVREAAWTGSGTHAQRLEEWLLTHEFGEDLGPDNALTREVLPWAVRRYGNVTKPIAGEHGEPDSPFFFKNLNINVNATSLFDESTELWFNTQHLADAWSNHKRGQVSLRTQSASAMKEQANALDAPSKRFKIGQSGGKLAYYRKLVGPMVEAIVDRSQDR